MPLSLPIENNLSSVVIDALALPDLAKKAAVGCIIDLQAVDGGVPRLVLVVEASVFSECTPVNPFLLNVIHVSLGGPVVARSPRLPFIARKANFQSLVSV